ncbi:MAG: restriction endonuclease [Oligosphaeraceae bacterium]
MTSPQKKSGIFQNIGENAEILAKNYSGKVGDCDVSAVFPALRLTISVQVKKHWGQTGDGAVQQILDYANSRENSEANWTYVNWVVSFADDFSEEAKTRALEQGIILLKGVDFCQMLVANGIGFA